MRSTFSARMHKAASSLVAALLAFTLMPSAASADESVSSALADGGAPAPLAGALVSSRTFTLPASMLSDASAITITSGVVELATEDTVAPLASALSTIRTTYVAGGCVYTFDEEAGEFTLVNAANAHLTEEGYLVVPSALVRDGAEHPVTNIAAGALSTVEASLVAFSAQLTSIDASAASGNAALQAVYVSPDNEAYASSGGCLYSKTDGRPTSLLLVPEGKQGAVRIPSGAEVEDPEAFSHCAFVDAVSVDAGSAAFTSRNVFIPDTIDVLDATEEEAAATAASPLGEPIELDYTEVVFDEAAFAPVVIPNEGSEPAASSDEGTDLEIISVEAPLGAPIEGLPSEQDASGFELSSRDVSAAQASSYEAIVNINDSAANPASSRGCLPYAIYTNGTAMPSIPYVASNAPKRAGFVFMGLFDGSDWERANRYYNKDLSQTDCVRDYGFTSDGLVLYAGWAPVLKVDVPASVSVAIGTVEEIDAPRGTTAAIKNLSPWDVVCTSLEWKAGEIEGAIDDSTITNRIDNTVAETAVVDGHADAKMLDASTNSLSELFDDASKVALRITEAGNETNTGTIKPGVKTTRSTDIGHIALSASTPENPIVVKEFTYNFDTNGAKVETADAISNTVLVSVFKAANAPLEAVRASVLFDQNGADDPSYRIEAKTATFGQAMPAIPDEDTEFAPPVREGYAFMGYFDTDCPRFDESGDLIADSATQYYNADGSSVRTWDRTRATTLYAGWKANGYELRLHANGGKIVGPAGEQATLTYSIPFDEKLSIIGALPTAKYAVNGTTYRSSSWWTDPVGGSPVTDADLATMYMRSTTGIDLYVHWDVNSMPLSVTLVGNGGMFGGGGRCGACQGHHQHGERPDG